MKKKFKDKCDKCKKMTYCKGYNGLVLCENCSKKEIVEVPKVIVGDINEQTRFNI